MRTDLQQTVKCLSAVVAGFGLLASGCVSDGGRMLSLKKHHRATAVAAQSPSTEAHPSLDLGPELSAPLLKPMDVQSESPRIILPNGIKRPRRSGNVVQSAFVSTQVIDAVAFQDDVIDENSNLEEMPATDSDPNAEMPEAESIPKEELREGETPTDENTPYADPPELKLLPPTGESSGSLVLDPLPLGVMPDDGGAPFNLDMNAMEIRQALHLLSRESGKNIVVSSGVEGTVTGELKGVTFTEALQAILSSNNLVARRDGNIIYVNTSDEAARVAAQNDLIKANGPVVLRMYRLNYVRAMDVSTMIKPFLSKQGKTSMTPPSGTGIGGAVSGGGSGSGGSGEAANGGGASGGASGGSTSTGGASGGGAAGGSSGGGATGGDSMAGGDFLFVSDTEAVLQVVDRLIAQLDVQPKQVLIEAVIMTVTHTNDKSLGVNFAVLDGAGRILGSVGSGAAINAAAGFDPSQVLTAGSPLITAGATLVTEGGKLAGDGNSGFASNSQGLKFGFVDNNLTGFISALESVGTVDILASPRLLVLNKMRAELQLGNRLGFQTLTQNQTSTIQRVEFLNVGTQLYLRPFISSDGMVRMEIHPEKSEGSIVNNIPQTRTSQIITNVMVPDGSTIVIGGLMESTSNVQQSGVPGLSRLPWVGALFRNKTNSSSKTEMIVLLTPRIWKQNSENLPLCPPPANLLIPTYNTGDQP